MSIKKVVQKTEQVNGQDARDVFDPWRDNVDGLGSGENAPDQGHFVSEVGGAGSIPAWSDTSACLSRISAQSCCDEPGQFGRGVVQTIEKKVKSFINHCCVPDAVRRKGHHDIEVWPGYIRFTDGCTGNPDGLGGGRRGQIKGFSPASQKRLTQELCSLEFPFDIFQTFTIPDDVVPRVLMGYYQGSSDLVHRFSQEIHRRFGLSGIHRREWIKRKSGKYQGISLPHFHFVMSGPGLNKGNYQRVCVAVAKIWVGMLGTKDPKAVQVATHRESYDWIGDSYQKVFRYICKYITKKDSFGDMLTGRAWGRFGYIPKAKPVLLKVSRYEMVELKRRLKGQFKAKARQAIKKVPGRVYKRILRMIHHGYGFLYISATLFTKIVEFIRKKAISEVEEYFTITARGPTWATSTG